MDEEAKRLHKAFEDARRAEEADIGKELREIMILFVIIAVVGVVIGVLWSWIKSWLGF
jgi:NhaP-type Na+/H+ or K+/H+ antiporter